MQRKLLYHKVFEAVKTTQNKHFFKVMIRATLRNLFNLNFNKSSSYSDLFVFKGGHALVYWVIILFQFLFIEVNLFA